MSNIKKVKVGRNQKYSFDSVGSQFMREILSEITSTNDLKLQIRMMNQHIIKSDENNISIINSPYPLDRYSCAVYALGFVNDDYYESIASGEPEAYASPEFICFLINKGYIEHISESKTMPESLIVYRSDGVVRHVGIMISKDKVKSKWGLGYLYEHGIFEVPIEYGSEVEFYKPIDKELALDYFIEFARSKGVVFE